MSKVIVLLVTFWIYFINSEVAKRSVCKSDEIYIECSHCGPEYCTELGYPTPCAGNAVLCNPKCVCIDGYVRDSNDTCITKVECPSCGGDSNATSGCGDHCGNSCSDFREMNKTCFRSCRYNSCDCKPGYVHHEELNRCVLPRDC